MPLPDEFIYQLKLANPIDTTMGRYVHLIRSGSNYKCLCPFHSDAFQVRQDNQIF